MATAVLSFINFMRPYWTPARSITRIAIHGACFLTIAALFRAGEWVVARTGATLPDGAPLERVVDIINASCEIGLLFTCIVSLVQIVRELRSLKSRRNSSSTSGSAPAGIVH